MNLVDFVILAVVAVVITLVALYLHRAKRKGIKCIGCPDGAKCADRCAGCSGNCCGNGSTEK
jgi:hypothetical protein